MKSSRAFALKALDRWRNGAGFADKIVAETFLPAALNPSDRGFALELFYGVLRNLSLLDFWIAQLRSEPIEAGARDLLRLGLYQIMFLETAPHAAVFETVELARARARNLINAVLRRALREKVALTNAADAQPLSVRFSEPEFLLEKWTRQFGAQATLELCQWNNRPAPIYARVNQLKTTVADFLHRYHGSFILPQTANFVRLPKPTTAAPNGDGYIQDPSTAMACEMLRPSPGERLLDACAAPGGKSAYLAEMMANEGVLVAADRDEGRLARLGQNLVRLGVTNTRLVPCDWLDGNSIRTAGFEERSFDKILVDAPCTNTGAMRRRVDVRWRLRPEDFRRMPQLQVTILRAVAPLLRSGGSLVYSTCSLEPEENEAVIAAFQSDRPGFRLLDRKESLPFREALDGAFAARLEFAE
ncbi:MAG: 16S rRNA (cytosine(967)-C(5))-methyltransferase RsmB [Chthoniobacterales bacterium]